MALIEMVNAFCLLGRQKLVRVFSFCFEYDVISLCNDYTLIQKTDKKKK